MSLLNAPTFRFTVEEYEQLGRDSYFGPPENPKRVELLNGEIVVMSPMGYRRATAVMRLNRFFSKRSRERFDVRPQLPFNLDLYSQPEPDVVLVDCACDGIGRHPGPEHIFLVIEVGDSTVRYDRNDKAPAYGAQGIREYWLLKLNENVLEVFRQPWQEGYTERRVLGPDESMAPLAFPDLATRVGDFLP